MVFALEQWNAHPDRDGARGFISLVEVERDDSIETGGWVTFDSVAKDCLESFFSGGLDGLLTLRAPLNKVVNFFPDILEDSWVEIKVSSSNSGEHLVAEVIMFGDVAEQVFVSVLALKRASNIVSYELERWSSRVVSSCTQANVSIISGVLNFTLMNVEPIAVAVYDVGQGNCNAIVDAFEHPRVFFDLGWAPGFHHKTRPSQTPNLLACGPRATAPVVLSHWDMDHWCYAIARSSFNPATLSSTYIWNPVALMRFWIARAPDIRSQPLGPLALSFFRALSSTEILPGLSALLIWPETKARIGFAAGWVEACRPGRNLPWDRNNTGLAMFVRPTAKSSAIALTGDADFLSIPSLSRMRPPPLAGVVAPHHGGKINLSGIPRPKKSGPAQLVVSVGAGNSYGHPKKEALDGYESKGWSIVLTHERMDCQRLPSPHVHGNTLMRFSNDDVDPECGCGLVMSGNLCLHPITRPAPKQVRLKSVLSKSRQVSVNSTALI